MESIKKEKYKNCLIKIYQDENYEENPNDWNDEIVLVNYHRDYYITSKTISEDDTKNFYQGQKIDQEKDFYIFPVSCLIHSGVWLSLNNSFVSDGQGWDTSHVGLILVSKKEAKTEAAARKIAGRTIKTWNYINEGSVYGFTTEDEENGKEIDSCWGFIGDIEESGILNEARASIDYYIKTEKKKAQKGKKDYSRISLGELLSSDIESIRRNAIGILKQLQK